MNYVANIKDHATKIEVDESNTAVHTVNVGGETFRAQLVRLGHGPRYVVLVNNKAHSLLLTREDDGMRVQLSGHAFTVDMKSEQEYEMAKLTEGKSGAKAGNVQSPMAGGVLRVLIAAGDDVEKGQTLMIVEAMKMENEIKASITGKVTELKVKEGDSVKPKQLLAVLTAPDA